MRTVLTLALLLIARSTEAKVFDFSRAKMATFINGEYGSTNVQDTAFGSAGGSGNTFDMIAERQSSGEFGFLFTGGFINFLISAEFMGPSNVVGATGSTAGGTKLMKVNSSVNAVIGNAGFEVLLRARPHSHLLIGAIGGYGTVTMNNDFTLNTNGIAKYPGVGPSYSETGSGTGVSARAYFGWEFLLTDNVTCNFTLGYRYFVIQSMTYVSHAVTVNSTVNAGDAVKDSNGTTRELDLGGGFAGIGFRFYFL